MGEHENGRLDWLHDDLRDIKQTLTRMEDRLSGRIDELDKRVSALERWRTGLIGAWSVLAAAFGISAGRGHS